MRRITSRAWPLALLLAGALASATAAQVPAALVQGFDLERNGRNTEAAERFRSVLSTDPTNLPALLGLERVLTPLGQLDSLIGPVRTALAKQPTNRMIRAIELRVWAGLGRPDSVTAAAHRWLQVDSVSSDVYREWAYAVAQRGDLNGAQTILQQGLDRTGSDALLVELAQMAGAAGAWADAAKHWRNAVAHNSGLTAAATVSLERAPAGDHDAVLQSLTRPPVDSAARRTAADLLLTWERAGEAWTLLDSALPAGSPGVPVLQHFAERAALGHTTEGLRARGFALERMGTLLSGSTAARARVDAARAFADAGDQAGAERVLEKVATDGGDPATAGAAMATLIGVMSQSGRVSEAEEKFTQWLARLPDEQATTLRRELALAWLKQGEPDRADHVLGPDSSGEGLGLRGWVALYRGDLRGAADHFREAGPYSGSRAAATERAEVAAILQRVHTDSSVALGRAFLLLGRGDTTHAIGAFGVVAATLPAEQGRGDVLALGGRLAAAAGQDSVARSMLTAAVLADSLGPAAPGAELALAQLEARKGERALALKRLEHLIMTYGESAVVPQARRLLDQLRGAVPES